MRLSGPVIMVVDGILALAIHGPAAEPNAADLVRQVRQREAWIETVDSIRIRAVQNWERTQAGLDHSRRQLEKQFPGSNPENDPNLRRHVKCNIEQANDRQRIRLRVQDEGYSDDLRIWDGKRFTLQNRYAKWPGLRLDQDGTLYKSDLSMLSWLVWSNFSSFRSGLHLFWWNSPKERAEILRMSAKPEDFVYEGRAEFHGITCHVVSHWDSWTSLFIGVDDGCTHGIRAGAQTTAKLSNSLVALYRELGREVHGGADMARHARSLTLDEQAKLKRLGAARLTKLIDPCFEFQLSFHKEIAPGCRVPFVQVVRFFESDAEGWAFESQRNEMRILECKVNQPLPDSLFTVILKEGEWINDQTHDPPLRCRHKPSFTPDEWSAIVEEARQKAEQLKAVRKR